MQRAWSRIAASPTGTLETHLGTVQYADQGAGPPVLVCHGVFGCHADAVDGWWTRMLGEGFRIIAPSRFGYFGSTLPPNATPADQAEVYTLLLDQLGIDRAAIVAYSAGSASALELALRHPDRVLGLVLANARLGGPTPNKLLKPVQGTVYGWERLWWLYRRFLPSIYGRMVGVPKGYQPTPEDVATIRGMSELQFPLKPRRLGAVFDGFVSNMVADDHWARHQYAVTAAGRVPDARLVTIDRGGHLFLSHDAQVRAAIGGFIELVAQPERRRR
jgi:pimeloyl-ACP methyl ester carboxylesterase